MAGEPVPAAGEIGADTNSNATQETLFEALAEALRRTPGVGEAVASTYVISAGSITPSVGSFLVDTEGAAAADNLDTIDQANYLPGSIILFRGAAPASRVVTIRHAVGNIFLTDGNDYPLTVAGQWLMLRVGGSSWSEVCRFHGTNLTAARAFLGLGTSAVLDDGDVDAATLEGSPKSAFLLAAATAANSTLFAGLAAAAFLRADLSSLQTIAGGLRANIGIVESNHPSSAGAPALNLLVAGVKRARLVYDGVNEHLLLELLDSDESTVLGGVRISEYASDGPPEYWDGAAWKSVDPIGANPFPTLNRIRWYEETGFSIASGNSRDEIHAEPFTALPSSGNPIWLYVRAGCRLDTPGGDGTSYWLTLHMGPAGDKTDALVGSGPVVFGNDNVDLEIAGKEFYGVPGDFVTLCLNKVDTSRSQIIEPSIDEGYRWTELTFLRVDQIG